MAEFPTKQELTENLTPRHVAATCNFTKRQYTQAAKGSYASRHDYLKAHKLEHTICAAYFFVNASLASFYPFLSLFLIDRGASLGTVALCHTTYPIGQVVGSVLWSTIADKHGKRSTVLCVSVFLALIARVLIYFYCDKYGCGVDSSVILVALFCVTEIIGSYNRSGLDGAVNALLPMVDSKGGLQLKFQYGQLRCWGSAGWGLFALIVGFLVRAYGTWVIFVAYAALAALSLPLLASIPSPSFAPAAAEADLEARLSPAPVGTASAATNFESLSMSARMRRPSPREPSSAHTRMPATTVATSAATSATLASASDARVHSHIQHHSVWSATRHAIGLFFSSFWDVELRVMVILLVGAINGFCYAVILTFQPLFLRQLGAADDLIGGASALASIGEFVGFYFSKRIEDTLKSPATCLMLSLLAYSFRTLWYSFLGEMGGPYFTLWVELLQGVSFGLGFSVSVRFVAKAFAPQWQSTAQTTLAAFTWGLGMGCGNMIGGPIYEKHGPWVFRTSAIVAHFGFCVLTAFRAVVDAQPPSKVDPLQHGDGFLASPATATSPTLPQQSDESTPADPSMPHQRHHDVHRDGHGVDAAAATNLNHSPPGSLPSAHTGTGTSGTSYSSSSPPSTAVIVHIPSLSLNGSERLTGHHRAGSYSGDSHVHEHDESHPSRSSAASSTGTASVADHDHDVDIIYHDRDSTAASPVDRWHR